MTRNIKEFVNHARPFSGAPFPADVGEEHVCILLGLKNGAATLGDQLDSIADQSHGDWSHNRDKTVRTYFTNTL